MPKLTPVEGAEARYDDNGNEIIRVATCGHCGRSWNDAAISARTPVPSGRCPFEYDHEDEDENQTALDLLDEFAQAAVQAALQAKWAQAYLVEGGEPTWDAVKDASRAAGTLATLAVRVRLLEEQYDEIIPF